MEPVTIDDESETGFGWISGEPVWMERASHALATGGSVWLVDPVDFAGLDDRVSSLGEPRGVLQLLGWHTRDCAAVAARLGVPHLVVPSEVPDSPFEAFPVPGFPGWRETALWWPETNTLVVAEAVGTTRYYCAPESPLGVHPFLRLLRPPRVLLDRKPEHLLVCHGRGLHRDAASALEAAVARSRRDLPRVVPRLLTARRSRGRP